MALTFFNLSMPVVQVSASIWEESVVECVFVVKKKWLKSLFHRRTLQEMMPRANTWTASFPARLDSEMEGTNGSNPLASQGGLGRGGGSNGGGGAATEGGGCSNPATDGVYVYVWHAGSKRVHKVGEKKGYCLLLYVGYTLGVRLFLLDVVEVLLCPQQLFFEAPIVNM